MRDPELMLDLLLEMEQRPFGRLNMPRHMGMSEAKQQRHHQVELLVDAGHAAWTTDDRAIVRITNAGYDFLNAVKQGENYKSTFVEQFRKGVSYLEAAMRVIELVQRAVPFA